MLNNPYLLLTLAPLIWGGNAVVSKLAVGEIAPMTLVFFRWTVALLVILPIALPTVRKDWGKIRRHWLLLCAYGCFGFAGFNMLFYAAGYLTTAVNIALLQASIPAIILLLNSLCFRQGFKGMQLLGLFFASVGVVLIVTAGKLSALLSLSLNQGDMLMLLASVMYALYSIGLRYKPDISWLSFIVVLASAAWVTVLPFAVYENMMLEKTMNWSLKSLLLIVYIAVFASIILQIAYAKGISIIGANRGGFAINLVPIFGALLSVLILDEKLHAYHLIALVLILGGIALSEKSAKTR